MSQELPIRALPFERRNELRVGTAYAFAWDEGLLGDEPDPDFDALYEADRSLCAFDRDVVVGTLTAFSLQMTVPGGAAVATAGTTAISVRPTHRRQGLLRRLMAAHLDDIRERGEPLSALWASESSIYRRFGYGEAVSLCTERIDRSHTALLASARPEAGRCRMVSADEALALFPGVYERARRQRAGTMVRSDLWWKHRVLRDAPYSRHGGTPLRRVVYERDGEARGYMLYRMRNKGETNELLVTELIGEDGEADRALYGVACGVDLVRDLVFWNRPVDCPLPLLLEAPRHLVRETRDSLWVRLTDVPAALAARRYATDGRLRIAVRDASWPQNEGTFLLESGGGAARCERLASGTAGEADLALDVADLGAAYLGGVRVTALARANRARGSAEALRLADALFQSERPPYNPELF
jgi:predicted acetyltransferase